MYINVIRLEKEVRKDRTCHSRTIEMAYREFRLDIWKTAERWPKTVLLRMGVSGCGPRGAGLCQKKNPSRERAQTHWRWTESTANLSLDKYPLTGKLAGKFAVLSRRILRGFRLARRVARLAGGAAA